MLKGECKIGQKVVYRRGHIESESGVVTSMNDSYAFVRYRNNSNSKATYYDDLEIEESNGNE